MFHFHYLLPFEFFATVNYELIVRISHSANISLHIDSSIFLVANINGVGVLEAVFCTASVCFVLFCFVGKILLTPLTVSNKIYNRTDS